MHPRLPVPIPQLRRSLPVAVLLAGSIPAVAQNGHIAGVRGDQGVVYSLATGAAVPLPGARRPGSLALSPDSAWAIYFASTRPKPSDDGDDSPYTGYAAKSPFRRSVSLPAAIRTPDALPVQWLLGDRAAIEGETVHGIYTPSTNAFKASPTPIQAASRDGSVIAYSDDRAVYVTDKATGRVRKVFSIGDPAALVRALAHANFGKDAQGFEYDPEMAKDPTNWMISDPVLTSDGRTLYFCTNAGTGEGAQGNTSFCVVSVDVASGRLRVLDRLGLFFGRSPSTFDLSPDGRRLLISSSVHNSAADNSFVVLTADLKTNRVVNLLATDRQAKSSANVVKGACWSPDSRYVAVSVFYYNAERDDAEAIYNSSVATLEIKDAGTARTVKTVPNLAYPSWGR